MEQNILLMSFKLVYTTINTVRTEDVNYERALELLTDDFIPTQAKVILANASNCRAYCVALPNEYTTLSIFPYN